MAQYLTPGVYLEEVKDAPSIQGVSTATGAFVGATEKGPFGATLVTSFKEFITKFGSFIDASYLAYAVKGFFENGGSSAYISRAVHMTAGSKTSAKATKTLTDGSSNVIAHFDAISDGTWGNVVGVAISNWQSASKSFDVVVTNSGAEVERYTNVTLANIEDTINPYSAYVTVVVADETANITNQNLALTGGNDGLVGITGTDYVGDAATKSGIYAFDNSPINMIAIPGVTDATVLGALQTYAENNSVFAIVETPSAKTPSTALDFRKTIANLSSGRVAMYYPWVKVADAIGVGANPVKLVPPSGHIMGVYARTDANRGVFKAPAGEGDGVLQGVTALEYSMNDAEQSLLNPAGLNAIRALAGAGIVLWGARTQAAAGDVFQYIPVRRSTDYVEQSILDATRWAVFEVNDDSLYGKIKSSVEGFLRGFWRSGGLKGTSESDAFIVRCDKGTTSDADVAAGRVFVEVGIATQKPAEFIIFRVQVR